METHIADDCAGTALVCASKEGMTCMVALSYFGDSLMKRGQIVVAIVVTLLPSSSHGTTRGSESGVRTATRQQSGRDGEPQAVNRRTEETAEFFGPLEGWLDVRRDFGAKGDGRTDDTAALQNALDALLDDRRSATALFLPPGTYRITGTLKLPRRGKREAIGLNIQGASPTETLIVWDGSVGGVMFDYNAWYSKVGRITFDGAGKAASGIRHGPEFVTGNEFSDMVFRDLNFGIEAGRMDKAGIAETAVLRCKFQRCTKAGVSIQNFNSLDWWIWDSLFEDCTFGVTNRFGAGNFHVYRCLFRRSREADVGIGNTGFFSFRGNTSVDSKKFFLSSFTGAGARLTFQGNTVINCQDARAIQVDCRGCVFLLDNTIVSRAEERDGPVVTGDRASVVSLGNTFTVSSPLRFQRGSIVKGDRIVPRSSAQFAIPDLPTTPRRREREVLRVPPGADAAAIQQTIDMAVRRSGRRPIIHFPQGRFPIDRTLIVPAGCEVQLVGDGIPYVSRLEWTGSGDGPIIRCDGPSRLTICDLVIDSAGKSRGIVIEDADQVGGRVCLQQTMFVGATDTGFLARGITNTRAAMYNVEHFDCRIGVRVIGQAERAGDRQSESAVTIFSGASSNNELSYEVAAGGRLVVRDIWYETNHAPRFVRLTDRGDFTLHGAIVALPRKSGQPAIEIDGFRGRIALLGVNFNRVGGEDVPAVIIRGENEQTRVLALGCTGQGDYFVSHSPRGQVARLLSAQSDKGGGFVPLEDSGAAHEQFVLDMLQATRAIRVDKRTTAVDSATHVRLNRVFFRNPTVGLELKARR